MKGPAECAATMRRLPAACDYQQPKKAKMSKKKKPA